MTRFVIYLRIVIVYDLVGSIVRLSDLPLHASAVVERIEAQQESDPIARRLAELGFVPGETVRLVATAPFGADPLLIQVGFTRFALRRSEADRVQVSALSRSEVAS